MEAIKELRRRRGWSQKDLANASGVGQDTISALELGRHEPRPSTLRKISTAFGVEVAELLDGVDTPKAAAPQPDTLDSARFVLEQIIRMDMEEFGQYAATLEDDALQRLRERMDTEGPRLYSTDGKALQRLALRSFVANLDLQVRKGQTAPEQAREQVAALVAAV